VLLLAVKFTLFLVDCRIAIVRGSFWCSLESDIDRNGTECLFLIRLLLSLGVLREFVKL